MPDTGLKSVIRKELRLYDNPSAGMRGPKFKNINYQNKNYLQSLLEKYNTNEQMLRIWANGGKKKECVMSVLEMFVVSIAIWIEIGILTFKLFGVI